MKTFHPEYIIDGKKKTKAVIISFDEWQSILEKIEELEDIKAYDKVKSKKLAFVTFEEVTKKYRKG
jgi:PHD/YefM family antitoxin component YafN of YafNO toxin-antitoxin module